MEIIWRVRNNVQTAIWEVCAGGQLAWLRAAELRIQNDAPFAAATDEESGDDPSLAQVERTMLLRALEKASWNQTRASQLLKISRDTLRYKIKKFNLKPPIV